MADRTGRDVPSNGTMTVLGILLVGLGVVGIAFVRYPMAGRLWVAGAGIFLILFGFGVMFRGMSRRPPGPGAS